ncbi:hypothetical protein IscW_ISCW004280, partial [Ixodes scapularis]
QVSIQSTRKIHSCGGSIISADVILTAAHCLEKLRNAPCNSFFKDRGRRAPSKSCSVC